MIAGSVCRHLKIVGRGAMGSFQPTSPRVCKGCTTTTLIASNRVPDELYQRVWQQFNETELLNLTYAVVAIKGWNRLAISLRSVPGSYQPQSADVKRSAT